MNLAKFPSIRRVKTHCRKLPFGRNMHKREHGVHTHHEQGTARPEHLCPCIAQGK
jgi:hypothetical protein